MRWHVKSAGRRNYPKEMCLAFPYQLVVFDLDGTLVDSASDIAESVNRTLEEWSLPRVEESVIRGWIGEGARRLLQQALEHSGSALEVDAVFPSLEVHYGDCLLLDPRVYNGVRATLDGLRDEGVLLAVCTNKPQRFIRPLLDALALEEYFECIVGGDTLSERKPSAVPLLHVLDHFGLQPGQCLMVGDSETDVLTAQAARVPMALVTYGYLRGFDPHSVAGVRVIGDMREILDAL
jgi:phosphoglycolate phosphatase